MCMIRPVVYASHQCGVLSAWLDIKHCTWSARQKLPLSPLGRTALYFQRGAIVRVEDIEYSIHSIQVMLVKHEASIVVQVWSSKIANIAYPM